MISDGLILPALALDACEPSTDGTAQTTSASSLCSLPGHGTELCESKLILDGLEQMLDRYQGNSFDLLVPVLLPLRDRFQI